MGTKYVDGISVKQQCLFTVSKEIRLKQANKLAQEAAMKKGAEHNTPWFMKTRIVRLEDWAPQGFGDLWLNMMAHFNTGRNKLYWLYVITWE